MIQGLGSGLAGVISQLGSTGAGKSADAASGGFSDVFKSAVKQVDDLQATSDQQVGSLLQGQGDVGSVMSSVEKADVAFQLMMQVRNKIVSAYQDIEKMQF